MQTRDQRIYRITLTGSIVNMVLLVLKFLAGILGHSAAMVADAVHSLSDFLTDLVVIAFVVSAVNLPTRTMPMDTASTRP